MKNIFFILFLFPLVINCQISGKVFDEEGNGLPYATIYVKNTLQGTTSNIEGYYELDLTPGNYELIYQYVGYEQIVKSVEIENPQRIDVELKVQTLNIKEIVIRADSEDPAYQIIRNAIKKREEYKNEINEFSADIYIKGLVKIGDTPEKFLGFNLGDLEGILDSNRQGIVYLSESKSKVFFQVPDKIKEVMYASKVAGDLEGISFNQYADVNFSFYNEHIRFNRNLLSPIADNALKFYDYKLESTYFDEQGYQINKIKVIPKNENDPVFFGHIYIVEDSWRIYTADLSTTGVSAKNAIFNNMRFKHIYVPLKDENKWVLFSQVMNFSMKFMVFNFEGTFSYFFSDFDISELDENIFDKETFKAEKGANKRDSIYWNTIRPIPITLEEKRDYRKKDSLEILWNSKSYMDSIDRENNKFKAMSLLLGYTYSNSHENKYFTYKSPLNSIQFNPIQGYTAALDTRFRKWNKKDTKFFMVEPKLKYGFADKEFRPSIKFSKRLNSIHYSKVSVSLGRELRQVNQHNPVSTFISSYENLLYKNNFLKLYETDFAAANFKSNFLTNFTGSLNFEYSNRKPVFVNTQYSWRRKDRSYTSNNSICPSCYNEASFEAHDIFKIHGRLLFRPKLTYLSFDERRINQRSNWPDFILDYKKAFRNTSYDFIQLSIRDERVDLNLWGYFSYNLEMGAFLTKNNLTVLDRYYLNGNESNLVLLKDYLSSFKRLPNYQFSTSSSFANLFFEYHLEGKLMDKIPILKNWGITSVFSYNRAQLDSNQFYSEYSFGFENINIGGIPLLRLDYVWSYDSTNELRKGLVVKLIQELN